MKLLPLDLRFPKCKLNVCVFPCVWYKDVETIGPLYFLTQRAKSDVFLYNDVGRWLYGYIHSN